jgi:hypothetical protein
MLSPAWVLVSRGLTTVPPGALLVETGSSVGRCERKVDSSVPALIAP